MSDKSNEFGRGFEFACINSLYYAIRKICNVSIIRDDMYENAKIEWDKLCIKTRQNLDLGAKAVIDLIFELEPMILAQSDDVLTLKIQPDKKGEEGDVRDLLISRSSKQWEIGLSLKHNHFAVKHSRLSKKIDFGEKWYGIKCSSAYWEKVNPIFDMLRKFRDEKIKWSEVHDKANSVYLPILNAFKEEIKKFKNDANVPRRLVEYLLGRFDFYKVVSVDSKRETQLFAYNLRGTLNKAAGSKKPQVTIPIALLPDRIVSIEMKPNSDNTVELYLNNGWQFSFRIHNASTKVEASLKFDIQIIGMPASIKVITCR